MNNWNKDLILIDIIWDLNNKLEKLDLCWQIKDIARCIYQNQSQIYHIDWDNISVCK